MKYKILFLVSIFILLSSLTYLIISNIDQFEIGRRNIELGNYNSAEQNFTAIVSSEDKNAEAYNNLGVAFHHEDNFKAAIENYNKAITIKPNYFEAIGNRGIAKERLRLYESAIEDYNKAIEINPKFSDAYNNRGWANKKLKEYDKALIDFWTCYNLNPEYEKPLGNIIELCKETNNYQVGVLSCDLYLAKNFSKMKKVYNYRSQFKEQLGDKVGASIDRDLAEKAQNKRHPDEPKIFDEQTILTALSFFLLPVSILGLFYSWLRLRKIKIKTDSLN